MGFDFVNKKPSKFFTITILALSSQEANRQLSKMTKTVLRRKINYSKNKKRQVLELKGTGTTLENKEYFYRKVKGIKFGIYSVTLNKKRVYERLTENKSKVYNYIARQVLDKIPFEKNNGDKVELIIDKSMAKVEIVEFNDYIGNHLKGKLPLNTPLHIVHRLSHESSGIQAVDLFC